MYQRSYHQCRVHKHLITKSHFLIMCQVLHKRVSNQKSLEAWYNPTVPATMARLITLTMKVNLRMV